MNLRNIFRRCFLFVIMILIFLAYFLFPSRSPLGNIPPTSCAKLCSSPTVLSSLSTLRNCEAALLVYAGLPFTPALHSPLFPHEVSDPRASHADRLKNQLTYVPSHISTALHPLEAIPQNIAAGPQGLVIPPIRQDNRRPVGSSNQNDGPIELKIPSPLSPIHVLEIRGLNERFDGLKVCVIKVFNDFLTIKLFFYYSKVSPPLQT